MEYILQNQIKYIPYTSNTCAVYNNNQFNTFTADMISVPIQYYQCYYIYDITKATFTPDHYVNKCYYTIRPTLFCDNFIEITDSTTMTLTVDFYDNDLLFSDKHVYQMNKQNVHTLCIMNIVECNHHITKISVNVQSNIPVRTTTLHYGPNSQKRSIGEIVLL